ncbi:MAG: type III pantothenate kinase [Firmicutes bacterium]|nr:type III pantothenate kinase [Bacillota bacterium]
MVLVVDVGNTNVVLGVYRGKDLVAHWRVSTQRHRTSDEYGILFCQLFTYDGLDPKSVDAVVISSVVPPLTGHVEEMSRRFFGAEPLVVGPGIKTGITIRYDNPLEVGADRIVNAVAAFTKYGGPVIVVDFGTATTFDAISRKGEYLGGAISPGIGISAEALYTRAARLPKIEMIKPPSAIGKNTVASMQSGILFGYAGLVDELVDRTRRELGGFARVVATGGLASLVAPETKTITEVDPWLTLEGLRLIYEMNAKDMQAEAVLRSC